MNKKNFLSRIFYLFRGVGEPDRDFSCLGLGLAREDSIISPNWVAIPKSIEKFPKTAQKCPKWQKRPKIPDFIKNEFFIIYFAKKWTMKNNFLPVSWCGRTGPGFLLFGIGISSPNWVPMRGRHHFILFFFRLWFFGRVFMIIIVTDLLGKQNKTKTHQCSCLVNGRRCPRQNLHRKFRKASAISLCIFRD